MAKKSTSTKNTTSYLGNPNLKPRNQNISYTKHELKEFMRCSTDPSYFINNYVKIINVDHGIVPFKLYPYQEKMVELYHKERFSIVLCPRQQGKTAATVGYVLWYSLYHSNNTIAMLANKDETAKELLYRYQFAYEHLPKWLQQGVLVWNKGDIELENGTRIISAATSSAGIRGKSINLLVLDEFAHVEANVQSEFFQSVYPTISSGKSTKIIITSTPKGMELFYKIWSDCQEGKNSYKGLEVHWSEVPGRDEAWKQREIAQLGSVDAFEQEYNNAFIGSTNTLISGRALRVIATKNPIRTISDIRIFEEPKPTHSYTIVVDTSHGTGQDYSAFSVIDNTEMPYRVAATFYKNDVPALLYPTHIFNAAKLFNNAVMMIEVNDIGMQVANIIKNDFEYENILFTTLKGQRGQILGMGYGGQSVPGVKTTKSVKKIGCAVLKSLIEENKLLINDYDILYELFSFVSKADSFEAEEGKHDDLVMTLVIFAWMTVQDFFRDLVNSDLRERLFSEKIKNMDEEILPFFINNGVDQFNESSWKLF